MWGIGIKAREGAPIESDDFKPALNQTDP